MLILRFIGGVFAMLLMFVVSLWSKLDLTSVLAAAAFLLVVDTLICKYIVFLYMNAVLKDVQYKDLEDNEDKDDHTSS